MPASLLLTVNTIPESFRICHKGITVHGLLASYLAYGGPDTSRYSRWEKSWPSMQEFQDYMPVLWPSFITKPLEDDRDPHYKAGMREAASILPPAVSALMYRQKEKLNADWNIVSKVFPDRTLPAYTYYWLIVNSQSSFLPCSSCFYLFCEPETFSGF